MIQKFFQKITGLFKKSPSTKPRPAQSKDTATARSPQRNDAKPVKKRQPRRKTPSSRTNRDPRRSPHKRKPVDQPDAPPWNPDDFQVEPEEGKLRFHDLDLPEPIMHAIYDLGFTHCTPIQAEIVPSILNGADAAGRAQTGTGKTAAFLIAVMTNLLRNPIDSNRKTGTPRVLIVAPTRELVMQITKEAGQLAKYTTLTIVSIFGGMDYEKQRRQLSGKIIDFIVATPGRLLDFQRNRELDLSKTEVLIIDEADRMLDMGFYPDMRKIVVSTPPKKERQTLLFSATLTPQVTRLAAQWTQDPVNVEIEPDQVAVDTVDQQVFIVTTEEKTALLINLIQKQNLERVMVFCNRRDETRRLADFLSRYQINCSLLSGDVQQKKRIRTLEQFREGKIRVLVATDVAGRGIHIEGVSHVINYTLPNDPEDYVHRIGRTGRAGASGISVSFADETDSFQIPGIEDYIGHALPCTYADEAWLTLPPRPPRPRQQASGDAARDKRPPRSRRRRRPSNRRRPRRPPADEKQNQASSQDAPKKRRRRRRRRRPSPKPSAAPTTQE